MVRVSSSPTNYQLSAWNRMMGPPGVEKVAKALRKHVCGKRCTKVEKAVAATRTAEAQKKFVEC